MLLLFGLLKAEAGKGAFDTGFRGGFIIFILLRV